MRLLGLRPVKMSALTVAARMAWVRWWRVLLAALLVTFVAKGGAYQPGYSIDDYRLVHGQGHIDLALLQGRFAQYAVIRSLIALQLDPAHARTLYVTIAMLISAGFGTLVVRWWGMRPSAAAALGAAMVANHPYTAEIYTFRTAVGPTLLPLGLFAVLLLPRRWSRGMIVGGSVLVGLLMGLYQGILHYAGMAVIGAAVVRLAAEAARRAQPARSRRASARGRSGKRRALAGRWARLVPPRFLAILACLVLGVTFYLAANGLVLRLTNLQMVTPDLLDASGIDERVIEAGRTLRYRLLDPNPILAFWPRMLQLALLVLAAGGLLASAVARRSAGRLVLAAGALAAIAAGLVWSLGVTPLLGQFWPTPRSMAHTGLLWAALVGLAARWPIRLARRMALILVGVLLLSYVGVNNRILLDQHRLNQRDISKAVRILADLEEVPGFTDTDAIAIHGHHWTYPQGFSTADMDMNVSAFGAAQAKLSILNEISGRTLYQASDPSVATAFCRGRAPWPAPGSVGVVGEVAVVCLDDSAG